MREPNKMSTMKPQVIQMGPAKESILMVAVTVLSSLHIYVIAATVLARWRGYRLIQDPARFQRHCIRVWLISALVVIIVSAIIAMNVTLPWIRIAAFYFLASTSVFVFLFPWWSKNRRHPNDTYCIPTALGESENEADCFTVAVASVVMDERILTISHSESNRPVYLVRTEEQFFPPVIIDCGHDYFKMELDCGTRLVEQLEHVRVGAVTFERRVILVELNGEGELNVRFDDGGAHA